MPDLERRYSELENREAEGRSLSGVVVRYGDTARTPYGTERFERGAFGDVSKLDVLLNVQHDETRLLARTGAGLTLTDTPEALMMAADLPETRDADDALSLVRSGVLRGLSVEFKALRQRFEGGVRVISRAILPGLGLVARPAYPASGVRARYAAETDDARYRVWL